MRTTFILILFFLVQLGAQGQFKNFIDASKVDRAPKQGQLNQGHKGPVGREIEVNNLYLTLGGRAILPVMGETHFTRIKPEQWEDCILKMKACGVNIISTYLFWNQHEEIEGQFDWEQIKNLRAFVQLCAKHGMYCYPRIGPWSHGEARNGGTPDWILRKRYIKDRSNDPVYQSYVRKYFAEIARNLQGLYYKDGGNIIGIQLENEYWYAKEGEPHIQWLKKTARELGIDVPLYTVTGWGGGSVPPYEVIPLWGGYADEPWIEKVKQNILPFNFMFDSFRDNKHIGNEQIDREKEYMSYEDYPYFTCEMGVGVPQMYHRRVLVSPIDGLGMMVAKLGSGSNLLGYYVFAGGTNPRGILHGNEEEQEETGYWCRVPAKSYDFQAAIKESGELSLSYNQVKKLHYFTNDFGEQLAPMLPVIATNKENLQLAVRSDNRSGYLFGINYCRYVPKKTLNNQKFNIKFAQETLEFPEKPISIEDSTIFIWPMNLKIETALMKYATAQLMCKIENTYIFFQNRNINPELAFDNRTFKSISANGASIRVKDKLTIVNVEKAGKDCSIRLTLENGSIQQLIILHEEDANNTWILERNGKKECYIAPVGMYADGENIYATSTFGEIVVERFQNMVFEQKKMTFPQTTSHLNLTPRSVLEEAQWLESANFKDLPDYMERYHRFFFKEFSVENPAKVKKATLFIYPESSVTMNLNEAWVRQPLIENQLNIIDLTGYVKRGNNMLFLDFPFLEGKASFAARVLIEYANYDRIEFSTDDSWLTTDMYTTPSSTKAYNHPEAPKVVATPTYASNLSYKGFREWDINIPYGAFNNLSALYVHLGYVGDRAELYNGYKLCSDNYNDNTAWHIGLQRINDDIVEGKKLRLVVYPLDKSTKIFFDREPKSESYGSTSINCFKVYPETRIKYE